MNEPRSDFFTPEWLITVVVNIAMAIIAVLSVRGLLSPEEGQLWLALIEAIAAAIAPIVMAVVTKAYLDGRTEVKQALISRGLQ